MPEQSERQSGPPVDLNFEPGQTMALGGDALSQHTPLYLNESIVYSYILYNPHHTIPSAPFDEL